MCVQNRCDNRPAFSYALGFCTVVTPVSVVDRWRAITSTTAGESSVTDRPARCRVSWLVTRPMHAAHEYWQLAQTLLPSHPYLSKHDARHRPAWPTAAWSCCQLRGHCSARNHRIISGSVPPCLPPSANPFWLLSSTFTSEAKQVLGRDSRRSHVTASPQRQWPRRNFKYPHGRTAFRHQTLPHDT